MSKKLQPYIPPVINRPFIPQTEPNEESVSTLFMTVLEGSFSKIKKITSDKNISLNVRNKEGESLIHAILNNNLSGMKEDQKLELISELIGGGAPVGVPDKKNITPLHLACKYQYPEIVKLLLRNGAEVNKQDNLRMTPIHYAAQGSIEECKKRKKVKNLIPKPLASKTRDVSTQEMRNLTISIIDIFNEEKNFNQYLQHIKNTLLKVGYIYKFEFEDKEREFVKNITDIIGDKNKTDFEKGELVKAAIINLTESLKSISEGKIDSALKPMNIGPQNTQAWGQDISNKILPKEGPETIKEQQESKFKTSLNDALKKMMDCKNTLDKNIKDMADTNSRKIYNNIYNIIQINRAAEINRNIRTAIQNIQPIDFFIPERELRKLILRQDNDRIKLYEINGYGYVPIIDQYLDNFLPDNDNRTVELIRGTKKNRELWKKKGKLLPITDDTDPANPGVVTQPLIGAKPIIPNANQTILYEPDNNSRLFLQSGGIYIYKPYYYVSKYIFGMQQIYNHLCAINYNFDVFKNHIENSYFKEIYHQIMSNMLLSCYNIFQNMILCKNEIIEIKANTDKIINMYKLKFTKHEEHPYSYLLEYCRTYAEEINTIIDTTQDQMTIVYDYCVKFIDSMNEIVDLINVHSGIKFQRAFLEKSFADENLGDYDGIYDNPIKNFIKPPMSLDTYISIFGKFGNDINLMRKEFYLNYAPYIDTNFYISYINKLQPLNVPLVKNNIIVSSKGIDYNICNYPNPLKTLLDDPINEIKPRSGYLVSDCYNINDPTGNQVLHRESIQFITNQTFDIDLPNQGYGLSLINNIPTPQQNPGGTIILEAADNTKIGEIGIKKLENYQKKSDGALLSIKSALREHLYIIKYLMIQKLIEVFNNQNQVDEANNQIINDNKMKNRIGKIKNDLINSLTTKFMIEKEINPILYTIIGKNADELLNLQIKSSLYNGINTYVKNLIRNNSIVGDYSQIFKQYVGGIEKQLVYKTDTGFEAGLHKLYDESIEKFYKSTPGTVRINTLMQTANVMEDEEKIPLQYQIYNMDYLSSQDIKEKLCYNIEPSIIDLLANNKGRMNEKDSSGSSPLYYALEIMHPELINKLLNNRANVNIDTVKNNNGMTPYQYIINLYRQHNGILIKDATDVKEIIDKFTKPLYIEVKESLEANEAYKNNIIKYLDIVFPQLLIMYNNLLCSYAKSYIGNWSYEKQKKLEEMFTQMNLITNIDTKLPILEDFKQNFIKNSIQLDALTDKIKEQDKELEDNLNDNNEIKGMITNLLKRRTEINSKPPPHDQFTAAEIKSLDDKIRKLMKDVNLGNDKNNITKDKTALDNTITNHSQNMYSQIVTRIKNFSVSDKYLGANSVAYNNVFREVSKIYDDIFNYIIKNTPLKNKIYHTGFEDYFLYNKIWRSDLENKDKLKSIFNIHLLSALAQRQIIDKSINDIMQSDSHFELLKDLYDNIFVPSVNNMTELPQNWNPEENYILSEVLDIITHVVKHVMLSNLYYAIIKVTTKYIMELNPKTYEGNEKLLRIYKGSKENYNTFVREVVNRIINPNYGVAGSTPNAKLYNYILNEVPELLVKLKLDIYKDDIEKTGSLKSEDDIFNNIINILTDNGIFTIPKDSSLITNLKTYVFPYYKDLFNLTIPKMKSVIDNYNRYIMNENRFINVILMMNKRAREEIL
ncbi:ankyrin repeat protein [Indivirus ILV1]|uniref:Ankyrin repeat protein n=1 Tax=Indivirus ILV1 TaxID=1977633 RepID=A0A1V0SCK3_9VIRU|nr:ankyrin repeat protein [Indivirus ILV1]